MYLGIQKVFGVSIFLFVSVCCFQQAGEDRQVLAAWLCPLSLVPTPIIVFATNKACTEWEQNIFIATMLGFYQNKLALDPALKHIGSLYFHVIGSNKETSSNVAGPCNMMMSFRARPILHPNWRWQSTCLFLNVQARVLARARCKAL